MSRFLKRYFSSIGVPKSHYDVIIGGGGVMGCSAAYFLSQRMSPSSICIVERDTTYERASTVLSVGSIRQQFSCKANILLSLRSAKFLKSISEHLLVDENDPPDINFQEGGYLFLASNNGEEVLRNNHEVQKSMSACNKLLTSAELRSLYPWMNTDGLALGSLGLENEGWFDPYLLLNAFKRKVQSMGVHYINGEVTGLNVNGQSVKSAEVSCRNLSQHLSIECDYFLNAGGPHAASIAEMALIGSKSHPSPLMHTELPVRPRKRCVFVLSCPDGPVDMPMMIDPSGFYIRKESQESTYICGISPNQADDMDAGDLNVDFLLFEDVIWPLLAHRIPAFEATKVLSAWAGYYEYNTFDQNGIIGTHPYITNFVFANGFSGHGIQQSPEVGRVVSEIILVGSPSEAEVMTLGFDRIVNQQPLFEINIV